MGDAVLQPPVTISLRRLFPQASFVDCADLRTTHVTADSRQCRSKSLFAVIRGQRQDGRQFIHEALERGAAGLITEQPLPDVPAPQCIVQDVRGAYAEICSVLHNQPSRHLKVAGVTGTNGKTTVTWMVRSVLESIGERCGLLGTVEYSDGWSTAPSVLTTPGPEVQAEWLAQTVRRGAAFAALEVSSHALDQRRVQGTQFACGAITNITRDHFDYHGDFASYQSAKARLFQQIRPGGLVVLNRDDAGAWDLHSRIDRSLRLVACSLETGADVSARIQEQSLRGTRFQLSLHGQRVDCHTTLIGRHNLANCLTAAALLHDLGLSAEQIAAGLGQFHTAPGRLERIATGQPFDVFVDYAHTDDALERCLTGLRSLTPGRIIVVFGAGGDRDRAKRPLMGRAAVAADIQIVTSDNPRSEPPQRIIADILAGMPAGEPLVEPDRALAIRLAVDLAQPGDCVLIAGKGHEREQIIGSERLPFDDCQVVRTALARLAIERGQGLPASHALPFAQVG